MLLHYHLMNNGTKRIVGTGVAIITAIVAVVAAGVTLAGDVRADLRDVHASVDSLNARLRVAVEVGFGKVHQRLLTTERVVLSLSPPGE